MCSIVVRPERIYALNAIGSAIENIFLVRFLVLLLFRSVIECFLRSK